MTKLNAAVQEACDELARNLNNNAGAKVVLRDFAKAIIQQIEDKIHPMKEESNDPK